jgi:hypothetical protein
MRPKILLITSLLGAALLVSLSGRPQVASGSGPCEREPRLEAGSSLGAAVRGNALLRGGSYGADPGPTSDDTPDAMMRHVSTSGRRLAVVRDEVGDDVLVVTTPAGTREFAQDGEAMHPAWSANGDLVWAVDDRLGLLERGTSRVRTIPGPDQGGMLFAPAFATEDTVVAVRSAPPTRSVPEDEWSNDLWGVSLRSGAWRRLTRFPAGRDRWTAIRTPVGLGDGVVEFVRIEGTASKTEPPRFELWRLSGRDVRRVRALPGERYLAGVVGGDHVWNIPVFATATWRLVLERPDGTTVGLGCGAVAVEPMDVTDPDRRAPHGRQEPAPPGGSQEPTEGLAEAVLVGDFPDEAAADAAAQEIASFYGPTKVEVVRHADAQTVLRPGAWAVLLHLDEGADAVAALDTFRERMPQWAGMSWMVTP